MDTKLIVGIAITVIAVIALIIIFILVRRNKKIVDNGGLIETAKARYTQDNNIVKDNGQMNVTYAKNDEILKQGQTYVIDRKNGFRPGKYTILSTIDGVEVINIRVGGFVKSFKHGTTIIIADGDEITPVSNSIILR